jgi:hypothetical protein
VTDPENYKALGKSRARLFAWAVLSLALGGCANTTATEMEQYAGASVCCASTMTLPRSGSLAADSEWKLTDQSMHFLFPSGKSAFVALQISGDAVGRVFVLRSHPQGTTFVNGAVHTRLLPPAATFLDASGKAIDSATVGSLQAEHVGFAGTLTLRRTYRVPTGSSAVVLHADASVLGEAHTLRLMKPSSAGAVVVGTSVVPMSGASTANFFMVPYGNMKVEMQ